MSVWLLCGVFCYLCSFCLLVLCLWFDMVCFATGGCLGLMSYCALVLGLLANYSFCGFGLLIVLCLLGSMSFEWFV